MVKLSLKLPIRVDGQTAMAKLEDDLGCNIQPSNVAYGKDETSTACSRCGKDLDGRKIVAVDSEEPVWYQFHPECFEDGTVLAAQLAAEIAKINEGNDSDKN